MISMLKLTDSSKNKLKLVSAVVFIYILLFEFILPDSEFFPRPTLILESLKALWSEYFLFTEFAYTSSALYIAFLIALVIMHFSSGFIIKTMLKFKESVEALSVFGYFPSFFYAVLIAFWFELNWFIELAFLLIAFVTLFWKDLFNSLSTIKTEYNDAALSIKGDRDSDFYDVVYKSILPEFVKTLSKNHLYVWIVLLTFEFIHDVSGLGSLFNKILNFHDLGGVFGLTIVVSLLIFIGNMLIQFANKRMVDWE
ncbi:MAG: hypothetical protein K9I99_13295 [Melioribacteraceae bacterium]|nr:hypothetical protein [Melioribacteraceae bacterium]